MANIISGRIEVINQTASIASKNGGEPFVKRDFVIRTLRFNPEDGTPELSKYNTPIVEIQGKDNVEILNKFKVGDFVKVAFALDGKSVRGQDGNTKYFNTIRVTRIEQISVNIPQSQLPQSEQGQQQAQQVQTPFPPQTDDAPVF